MEYTSILKCKLEISRLTFVAFLVFAFIYITSHIGYNEMINSLSGQNSMNEFVIVGHVDIASRY